MLMSIIKSTLSSLTNNKTSKLLLPYFTNDIFLKPKDNSKGEDSHSLSDTMICLADGVGGWNKVGVDPSKYSTELIHNYSALYRKEIKSNKKEINDIALFAKASHLTQSIGSSTFCSLRININDSTLKSINLGDSGYILIRNNKILFKSKEQQHSFNFPFQVGTNGDSPMSAQIQTHQIENEDSILLGTDGLWDNMYKEQLLNIIKHGKQNNISNDKILLKIGTICYNLSKKRNYISPFSKNSNLKYFGGKPDDITIILSQIKLAIIQH